MTNLNDLVWVPAKDGAPGHWAFPDAAQDRAVDEQNAREARAYRDHQKMNAQTRARARAGN